MQKIVSLFQRNYDGDRLVRNEVTPGAEWVAAGHGVATRKLDGTCCLVRDGRLFKRYDVHGNFAITTIHGETFTPKSMYAHSLPDGRLLYHNKPIPAEFEPAQDPDPISGHWPGWVLVGDGPEDRWHREAVYLPEDWYDMDDALPQRTAPDGTYELCGPKIQGNPEDFDCHVLLPHGKATLHVCPRDFEGLKAYLAAHDIEGVVWHHDDGRMAKIKGRDFGIKRGKRA